MKFLEARLVGFNHTNLFKSLELTSLMLMLLLLPMMKMTMMVMTMTILAAAAYNTSKLYPSKHNFGQHRPIDTHCISRPYFLPPADFKHLSHSDRDSQNTLNTFSQSWQNIVRFLFESSLFKSLNISPAEINFPQYGTVSRLKLSNRVLTRKVPPTLFRKVFDHTTVNCYFFRHISRNWVPIQTPCSVQIFICDNINITWLVSWRRGRGLKKDPLQTSDFTSSCIWSNLNGWMWELPVY